MTFFIKLQWFFKQRWLYYTIAILLMILVNILTAIPPKIIGDVIDLIRGDQLTSDALNRTVLLLMRSK
jgi:ATP-binding cassette subfamily B protein